MKTIHSSNIPFSFLLKLVFGCFLVIGFISGRVMAETDSKVNSGTSPSSADNSGTASNKPLTVKAGNEGSTALSTFTDPSPSSLVDSDVIARVGNDEIKIGDVRAAIQQLDPAKREEVINNPSVYEQLVLSLSLKRIVYKEALSKHWDKDPAVAQQLERASLSIIADSYLISVSQPPAGYPNDAELRAAYEAGKADLIMPKQVHILQIFIALPKDASKITQDRAQRRLDAIREKISLSVLSFGEIARAECDEKALADRGGDMGWITQGNLPPLILEKVAGLEREAVSDPIRLDDGWHIIKVTDIRPQRSLTFEEAHDVLVQQLRAKRALADRQAYLEKLLGQNPVTLNQQVLSKAVAKH